MIEENQHPKVLVFDSGVGGLTVFHALMDQIPSLEVIFVSDNAGFPYGTRTEYSLIGRVHRVLEQLISKFSPDLVVVACNSASTVALPSLRKLYDLPFVGVVPAIKPAAALSKSGHIALLATPATVSRHYTRKLIDDFAADKNVLLLGSTELVDMAEDKVRGISPDPERLRAILEPLLQNPNIDKLDTAVLACTHFPLLIEELRAELPQIKHWVESGDAIARRVSTLLSKPIQDPAAANQHQAWLTGHDPDISALKSYLVSLDCNHLEVVTIDSHD
jgi:glutamate racemase|tara:strand:- start:30443 stop:31270 length:828 start_codon:yes stop_codon:yes gene_type:complete